MILNDQSTHYDVLEVRPDAPPQEIRAAYLRAKAAYHRDSPALYSLIDEHEAKDLLKKIEEAYAVLSNPEKRQEYDRHFGLLAFDEQKELDTRAPLQQKIISIDRVPPMEQNQTAESASNMLIPPTTDFPGDPGSVERSDAVPGLRSRMQPPPAPQMATTTTASPPPAPQTATTVSPPPPPGSSRGGGDEDLITQEINTEEEWRGTTIKRFRTARRISIEEVSEVTKISRTYLVAIEEENYNKLPAPVFVRGFLTQICRTLRFPPEKVVTAYMTRFNNSHLEKTR